MKLRRFFAAAVLSLVAAVGASAQVVLFEDGNFQGRKLTIRTDEPNLDDSDFNDRVSSVVVRAGAWQLCTDSEYRGDCMVLQPGEYRFLDRRFTRSISSLRPMDRPAPGYANPPPQALGTPQYPTSCSVGPEGSCSGCQITCAPGLQAQCKQGSTFAHSPGTVGDCAFQAVCACK